ncbi:hypothetical protein PIB30_096659 [Stylosanthes scabra]|uniref:Uncharacterized protein n=1 Tax=Stylosanthes scabra TaxID=79078 RepID=A0ABU6WVN6_9FABA|nr:hypothetical protein [Stylosanthes scabra]
MDGRNGVKFDAVNATPLPAGERPESSTRYFQTWLHLCDTLLTKFASVPLTSVWNYLQRNSAFSDRPRGTVIKFFVPLSGRQKCVSHSVQRYLQRNFTFPDRPRGALSWCINFQGQQYFMEERRAGLGWMFMYNVLEPINLTLVRELYSNFSSANKHTVFLHGKQIPITENALNEKDAYEKNLVRKNIWALDMGLVLATIALPGMWWDSYKSKFGRVNNAILTPQARGLMRVHHSWF